MLKKLTALVALLAALSALAGCGNDGDASRPETQTAANGDKFNDADVEFASDMIQHHSQALAMVDMTMGRQLDPEVQQLAEDIRAAQGPEIEQMTDLEAAEGDEFQQMWLEKMSEHHEGAIEMAQAEQSDGEFGPAVELAEQIEAAQQEEISTMQNLLDS